MDILLTHGYFLREDPHELKVMKPYPPLGILQLSAYLKCRGCKVGVFDSTFASFAEFESMLAEARPPVVGIYCNLMTRSGVLRMTRAARAFGAHVVLGGPEPANYAEEYLDRGADVVVFGEGETALAELLPALSQSGRHGVGSVAGIAYRRDDGTIHRTPSRPMIGDLDSLPDPDREAIEIPRYLTTWRNHHGAGSVSLICARGCPFHCTWCSHSVYGHTHRRRSPARVANEVEQIASRYHPDQLWYADDVFTIHHPWLAEYSAELKRRGLKIPFECISRADRLTAEVISILAEMGCYRLWIGSESGSQQVLDAMKRGVRLDQVRNMTHALKQRGIKVGMFIMLGYEGEGTTDLRATIDHIKSADPDVFLTTVAYPIKGTEYYERVDGRIAPQPDWGACTDRDLVVRGRHSRRFYSFATRWVVSSVALDKGRRGGVGIVRLARAAANAVVGRLGMSLTRHEVEK